MIGKSLLNYHITEKLGAGGQGTVYRATDEKLGRTVVIKILSPELTAKETNLKRFEREARLASALDHPNICTIYGLHELNGLHFIAMQWIDGQNVRELVAGTPLPLEHALSYAFQTADALTAAHARGIIHRDIKAGNVMVTDAGLVKVLDFGLAKLLDEGGGKGGDIHLTELGVPYGTATYAAPEQATGQKVDHRADIFSTGVLLYEMLAGTWPFRGKTSIEVRYAVLHDTPQPVSEQRPDPIPPRLEAVLDRALQKDPARRYQTMQELRDEVRAVMRELAGGGAAHDTSGAPGLQLVAPPSSRQKEKATGFGRTFRRWLRSLTGSEAQPTSLPPAPRQQHAAPSTSTAGGGSTSAEGIHESTQVSQVEGQKSIAILPFHNLSNDPEVGFYEFSLADAVITELARLRSLVVRPSSVIVKYQGKQVDPLEAGRDLRVSAVLSSNFLRAGDRLRVNVQLLDVASGDLVWSDRIDASAQDLIALQDTIAQRIVDGLGVKQTSVEKAEPSARPTHDPVAYEEYLRGRDYFGRYVFHALDPADCDAAIQHFSRAIQLDSSFALAYSGLGACHANRVIKGQGGGEDYEMAEEAFNKALEIDPDVVEARMLMVFIYLARGEKEKARAEVARLRRKAPNEAAVYFVKAVLHRLDGEYDRALRAWSKLSKLDSAARVVASYNRARLFMYQRRYDDALMELDRGERQEPDHPLIKAFRARVFFYQGRIEEATALLREVLTEHPDVHGIRPFLAMCLVKQGRADEARAELGERVESSADADHDIAYWLASAYALLGERDAAFRWLERAIELGNENRPWFESDPNWGALRNEPRFRELMSQVEGEERERAGQPHELTEVEPTPQTSAEPSSVERPGTPTPRATFNAAAYEEYLRGRDAGGRFIYHTLAREDSDESIQHFQRAIELDPDFALAHCALGGAYANRVIKGFGDSDDYARAEESFSRALALDPTLLEARLHMIFIYLARGEKQTAREWVALMKREAPNDVGVHFVNATLARLDGRYEEALESFGRMIRLNPAERVVASYNRARVLMYQGRYDDALVELDLGAQTGPNHPLIKTFRAVVLARRGDTGAAVSIMREVLARHPRMDGVRPLLAQFLTKAGDAEAARAELTERVRAAADADHDIAYWLATAHALLGERDEAFRWLERAVELGNENRPWFESDQNWETLRDDPRFGELMRRIGAAQDQRAQQAEGGP